MNKQVPVLFLAALLVALPSCMDKMDKGKMKKDMPKGQKMGKGYKKPMYGDRMAQGDSEEGMAVADSALADESLKSFFDDMDEFVAFNDLDDDRDEYAFGDARAELESVYFGFDKARPDEDQAEKIRANADRAKRLLEENPGATVLVEGYACPSAGKIWYNKQISERRAQAVAAELEKAGIDRESIKVVGRGTQRPVISDGDREEQWVNRRVEMNLLQA